MAGWSSSWAGLLPLLQKCASPPCAALPQRRLQGEDGYIRIARAPNDCGISAEPIYIELKVR